MHFPVLVIVPSEVGLEIHPLDKKVAVHRADLLLEPFCENDEWGRDGSRWDWWVVGGRWTGALDGYQPELDPLNIERCTLCGGTGTRDWSGTDCTPEWIAECNGCNGCKGTGSSVKWATQWVEHSGDVCKPGEITTGFVPHAVLTPDGTWHEESRTGLFGSSTDAEEDPALGIKSGGDDWEAKVKRLLDEHPEHWVVLVDCHV